MEPLDVIEKIFIVAKAVKAQIDKVQTNKEKCIMLVCHRLSVHSVVSIIFSEIVFKQRGKFLVYMYLSNLMGNNSNKLCMLQRYVLKPLQNRHIESILRPVERFRGKAQKNEDLKHFVDGLIVLAFRYYLAIFLFLFTVSFLHEL